MSGSLQLHAGPAELRAEPFPAISGTTLPIGASVPVRFVLDRALPAGSREATVTSHRQQVRDGAELVRLGGLPLRVGVLSVWLMLVHTPPNSGYT